MLRSCHHAFRLVGVRRLTTETDHRSYQERYNERRKNAPAVLHPARGYVTQQPRQPTRSPEQQDILDRYDKLLKNMQTESQLESLKHSNEAKCMKGEESAPKNIRVVYFVVLGVGILEFIKRFETLNLGQITAWIAISGIVFFSVREYVHFLYGGTNILLPISMSPAGKHIEYSFEWDRLYKEINVTLLSLQNPSAKLPDVEQAYLEHIKARHELRVNVLVDLPAYAEEKGDKFKKD